MKKTGFLCAWIFLSPLCFALESKTPSTGQQLNINFLVRKEVLPNGLVVLLSEDRSSPMVSYHTWYKVGSRNENEGSTGLSHMLEHMMFKGAQKYSGAQFDQVLHENGMLNNAFTTYDYTGFYQSLPSSKLELMMDIEVDRMSLLQLKSEDLATEREVVKEERRWRLENNPHAQLLEAVMATLFRGLAYRWPIIGTVQDIQNYSIEKLKSYYNTFYGPNNAVLVLVGDFDTDRTLGWIKKYYGALPQRPLPENKAVKGVAQTQAREVKIKAKITTPSLLVAYRTVPVSHQDTYALDLLSHVLTGGPSSRLYKKLVYEKQWASAVIGSHSSLKEAGVFSLTAQLKPESDVNKVADFIYHELWKLRTLKISEKELDRAKIAVLKSTVSALTSMDGKARSLAVNEILTGNYENLYSDLNKYQQVTVENILLVAQKYLKPEQRTLAILEPEK